MLLAVCLPLLAAPAWPPPAPPPDEPGRGAPLARSLALLAGSTPERRHTVRVLFYGQSITVQDWARQLSEWLRRRYPHADLVIENRAIGGFSSQVLVKTAEQDLYPFQPDLLIFHVYGDHRRYEDIIRRVRERTCADVLMATDHCTQPGELSESQDRATLTPQSWSAWMNHVFLPDTAAKYGCELAQVRREWKRYLTDQRLEPQALLSDAVHLNDHGCYVMAELLKPYLEPPAAPAEPDGRVRELVVGRDARWADGKLTVSFEGSRVDLIAAPGPRPATPAEVLIDGRPPSRHAGCYAVTRPTGYPGVGWPCLMRVGATAPRLAEEWTLRLLERDDACQRIRFAVTGSVTGPDGEGLSTEPFVSRSGRVAFEPDDWSMARSRDYTKEPPPDGFEVKWRSVLMGTDHYLAPEVTDPSRETATTLAQGLPPGPHTLELTAGADGPPPLALIRVWRPPLPATD